MLSSAPICLAALEQLPTNGYTPTEANVAEQSAQIPLAKEVMFAPEEKPVLGGFVACGLASHEIGYPASLYQTPLQDQIAKGFCGKCHSGEEWTDAEDGLAVALENICCCVRVGCGSIGHGVAALANGGHDATLQLLKKRKVALEMCPFSNACVTSTHYAEMEKAPIRVALDAGVEVVLGTDDANAWEPGAPGPSMREVMRHLLDDAGVQPEEMRAIAAESVRRAFMPDEVRAHWLKEVAAWDDAYTLPICDLHMHFVGSVPRCYLERVYAAYTYPGKRQGTAQQNACVPDVRRLVSGRCQNPWANLAAFAKDTYAPTYGVLLSEGVSAVADQIMSIARSCSQCGVVAITLQIGAPQGASAAWLDFYMDLLALAQRRATTLAPPCYIAYQADFIRNAPVGAARGIVNLMEKRGKTSGWLFPRLSTEADVDALKQQQFEGLREHPARFPCITNMYELYLLANAFVPDNGISREIQLQQIEAGLATFIGEVKTVSFLPEESPFRVQADSDVFGSEATFKNAVERSMQVIRANWGTPRE